MEAYYCVMPPTATHVLQKNERVYRQVVAWIKAPDQSPAALAGYAWLQDRWHSVPSETAPASRTCCVATAAVLLAGGEVIPPVRTGRLCWSQAQAVIDGESPRLVADAGRDVLGLTAAEAALVFSSRRTADQLASLQPFFDKNNPITPSAIEFSTRDELLVSVTSWLSASR